MRATEISQRKKRAWAQITEREILKERKGNKNFKEEKGNRIGIEIKIDNKRRGKENVSYPKNYM